MGEQEHRQAFMPGAGDIRKLHQIAPHPVEAVVTGVTKQVDLSGGFAVTAVVISVDGISGSSQC
ncbi:hypothetical protein D3C80_1391080 [compost metagenome]